MGYQKEHICVICNEKFISCNYRGMFCPKCRATRKQEYMRVYKKKYNKDYYRKKQEQKNAGKKKVVSINEIQRLANAAGMTYGQYTAMLEMQKEAKK